VRSQWPAFIPFLSLVTRHFLLSLVTFSAFGAVKQYPHGEVVCEVLEAVRFAGGGKQEIARLDLLRRENPIFALTWTIFHVIDQISPLFAVSAEDLASTDAVLVLAVSGIDDNSANALRARKSYSHDDVAWQHRYIDIMTETADGRLFWRACTEGRATTLL